MLYIIVMCSELYNTVYRGSSSSSSSSISSSSSSSSSSCIIRKVM